MCVCVCVDVSVRVRLIMNRTINALSVPIAGTPSEKEAVLKALGRKFLETFFILYLGH